MNLEEAGYQANIKKKKNVSYFYTSNQHLEQNFSGIKQIPGNVPRKDGTIYTPNTRSWGELRANEGISIESFILKT